MKSFLTIFTAIVGLIFLKPEAPRTPEPAQEGTLRDEAKPDRTIAPLGERNAQRDAHLKKRLSAAHAHGSNCACSQH